MDICTSFAQLYLNHFMNISYQVINYLNLCLFYEKQMLNKRENLQRFLHMIDLEILNISNRKIKKTIILNYDLKL